MILPSKHLAQNRALLTVGARILQNLRHPVTVSSLWEELPRKREASSDTSMPLSYDNFVLALDLLFLIGAIELREGLLSVKTT